MELWSAAAAGGAGLRRVVGAGAGRGGRGCRRQQREHVRLSGHRVEARVSLWSVRSGLPAGVRTDRRRAFPRHAEPRRARADSPARVRRGIRQRLEGRFHQRPRWRKRLPEPAGVPGRSPPPAPPRRPEQGGVRPQPRRDAGRPRDAPVVRASQVRRPERGALGRQPALPRPRVLQEHAGHGGERAEPRRRTRSVPPGAARRGRPRERPQGRGGHLLDRRRRSHSPVAPAASRFRTSPSACRRIRSGATRRPAAS